MALVQVEDNKAYRVESVKIRGTKYVSVRQMYTTKKDPDNWKPGRAGMTVRVEHLEALLKKVKAVGARPDAKFKELNLDGDKDE